jgi:hypothetical protein
MSLVGVKDLSFTPLEKRDLLLFDQIAVPDLNKCLSGMASKSLSTDIEWEGQWGRS